MVRVVAQRVRSASVSVDGEIIARIERGLAILIGIRCGDDEPAVNRVADKLAFLRIFEDDRGLLNRSGLEVAAAMLVVSQFTLYADLRKGRRPSFVQAAAPEDGLRLYECFASRLTTHGYRVQCGRFGAQMLVTIENDGPVTIVIDSADL